MENSSTDTGTETANLLAGMTILRFAHAFDTGGGVELQLRDLNRGLSQRNTNLTTFLVHLGHADDKPLVESTEEIGTSKIVRVPLPAYGVNSTGTNNGFPDDRTRFRRLLPRILDLALCSPALNRLVAGTLLAWRRIPRRKGEALGAGAKVTELLAKHQVDLLVLHTNGGSDASEVISAARTAGVPVALVHHFSNDKLGNLSVRQQAAQVDSLAGASAIDLPLYARPDFVNLSDAVDLAFFRRENARPVPRTFDTPVLFAPGRITRAKGQMDALDVLIDLKRRGIAATLVYAGRVDDVEFEAELKQKVQRENLGGAVHFAGELTLPLYRDWFSAASVMLMPTHHHEGMPRTLVDSQAMEVPPVVYDIGGTREGVKHNVSGYLVRHGDVAAMADHAARLLTDPALHRRMAAESRKFVEEQFSLEAFLARHERFYLNTVAHGQQRRNSTGKRGTHRSTAGSSSACMSIFTIPEFVQWTPYLQHLLE